MKISPKSTLITIEELENLGFNDDHFQSIHHWGNFAGKDSSLKSYKVYLAGVRSFQQGSNNFKISEKLAQCFSLAQAEKEEIIFTVLCGHVNGKIGNKKASDNEQNFERGLYIVTLNNQQPISANADDKRVAHKSIMVNKENCKFGKAANLSNRRKNYYKTFGEENVNFQPIFSLSEIDVAEKEVLKKLRQFRQLSPSGYRTEWLYGVSSYSIANITELVLISLGFPYKDLRLDKKGT
ncbi:MAG: hypothetical protein DRR42_16755 [Gammaproteobacteria bacterium]|nr:MAG: hypothetical protein DRR42_16755 [Gammaproteobacteria bacterium]